MTAGLRWLLGGDLPRLSSIPDRPRWQDAPDALVPRVATMLGPLVRALLLAGYSVTRLDVVRPGADPGAVGVDDVTLSLTLDAETDLDPEPASGSGLVLRVADLRHDAAIAAAEDGAWTGAPDGGTDLRVAFSHAVDVPAATPLGEPAPASWSGLQGTPAQIVLWTAADWLDGDWWSNLDRQAAAVRADVTAALARRIAAGDLTPRSRAGLLWLVNPLFWFAQDATFPGADFDVALMSAPPAPPVWAGVTSPAAQAHDPTAVELPEDRDLHVLTDVATRAWASSGLADDPDRFLEWETTGVGWLHVLLGTGPSSEADSGFFSWLARNRAGNFRRAATNLAAAAGIDAADRIEAAVTGCRWFEAVLDLADLGVLTPVGYPQVGVTVIGAATDETESIVPVYLPGDASTFPRVAIVLAVPATLVPPPPGSLIDPELGGVPLVVCSATAMLRTDLRAAVAWDFVPARDGGPLTVTVVAGPGVEVLPQLPPGPDQGWELEVFRVWNYSSVPARGARVQPEFLMAPYVIPWIPAEPERFLPAEDGVDPDPDSDPGPDADTDTAGGGGIPFAGVAVFPLPDGVAFEVPPAVAFGTPPRWRYTARMADPFSGAAGIAFDLQYGHLVHELLPQDPDPDVVSGGRPTGAVLEIWVTEGVTVTREDLSTEAPPALEVFVDAWTVRSFTTRDATGAETFHPLPPLQGETLALPNRPALAPCGLGPDIADAGHPLPGDATPAVVEQAAELGWIGYVLDLLDVGVGFVPVVGDVVDVAELAVSLYTNTDKWGRPVTAYDQMFMALGAIVPFASGAALRGSGHLAGDMLGFVRAQNEPLLRFIFNARSVDPAEHQLLELAGTSRTFNRMTDPGRRDLVLRTLARLTEYTSLATKLGEEVGTGFAADHWRLVDLTAPGELAFWFPPLQDAYRRWLRARDLTPSSFTLREFTRTTEGAPRALLEALLGDFEVADLRLGQRAVRSPKISTRWTVTASMVPFPSTKTSEYYAEVGARELLDGVEDLAADYESGRRAMDFADPGELDQLLTWTQSLLRRIEDPARPGTYTPEGLRDLMGLRTLEAVDLTEMLVRGCKVFSDGLATVSSGSGVTVTLEDYFRVFGHRSVFKDIVTQGGYQHGSVAEVLAGGEEFARRRLAGEARPEESFWLQNDVNGVKGPDLVRLISGRGQIVDSKSIAAMWTALAPMKGDAARQARRFAREVASQRLVLTTPAGVRVEPYHEFLFRIDPFQFGDLTMRHTTVGKGADKRAAGLGFAIATLDEWTDWATPLFTDEVRSVVGRIGRKKPTVRFQIEPLYLTP